MHVDARLASVVALGSLVAGCSAVSKEYTWTRQEPAVMRRSPTTFTVRLTVQPEHGRVLWRQKATDADGLISISVDTLAGCAFFDKDNWEWFSVIPQHFASMRNGELHEFYWGEERAYRTEYLLFGRSAHWTSAVAKPIPRGEHEAPQHSPGDSANVP